MKIKLITAIAIAMLMGCEPDGGTGPGGTPSSYSNSSSTSNNSWQTPADLSYYKTFGASYSLYNSSGISLTIDKSNSDAVGYFVNGVLQMIEYYDGTLLRSIAYYDAPRKQTRAYQFQNYVEGPPRYFQFDKSYTSGTLATVTDYNTGAYMGTAQLTWTTTISQEDEPGCILILKTLNESANGVFVSKNLTAETICQNGTTYFSKNGTSWRN